MGRVNIGVVRDECSMIAGKLGVVLFHGVVGGLVPNECLWMCRGQGECPGLHRSGIGGGGSRHWKNSNLTFLL